MLINNTIKSIQIQAVINNTYKHKQHKQTTIKSSFKSAKQAKITIHKQTTTQTYNKQNNKTNQQINKFTTETKEINQHY